VNNLDVLRAYTAQFGVQLGPDDEFLPHEPISGDAAAELVSKWSTGSVVNPSGDSGNDLVWSMLQAYADSYEVPLDEYLGAIWFVSQHNGAYKRAPLIQDQIGCAVGEVTRVLDAFRQLTGGSHEGA